VQLRIRLGAVPNPPKRLLAAVISYNATAIYDGLTTYEVRVWKKAFEIEEYDFVSDVYL
jgi:hypothetical protein